MQNEQEQIIVTDEGQAIEDIKVRIQKAETVVQFDGSINDINREVADLNVTKAFHQDKIDSINAEIAKWEEKRVAILAKLETLPERTAETVEGEQTPE